MIGRSTATKACKQLAVALRAGDDAAAASLAERSGIPAVVLSDWDFGPCATVDLDAAALALSCVAALAGGAAPAPAWLSAPEVTSLVADAVELMAADDGKHPWLSGITGIDPADCPGIPELLQARAEEGSGRSDEARSLIAASLTAAPGLAPAARDAMEYELCAGDWARAFQLASSLGDDRIASPLLGPLGKLQKPALGAERAGRNQPCPCGSGRKYKACCRASDLEGGMHLLQVRAPALYAMVATYAQRARCRRVTDQVTAAALGAPHAAMLALDLAIFDGGIAERFLASRGHLLRPDEGELLGEWLTRPVDMYEVAKVSHGAELTLRSMTGGPDRIRQRDRLFSMSVDRLDIVVTRLLPDGDRLPDGGRYLRVLGGAAKLDRMRREATQGLFTDGAARPGADPGFPVRLLSQFVPDKQTAFKTADGDEYRFCETTIDVAGARDVWDRLTDLCIPAPEPPILNAAGYDAFVAAVPSRCWTRNSDDEIEYVGLLDADRLTNLGTVVRTRQGFKLTANSAPRMAALTALVLEAATAVGRAGTVTRESAKTAPDLLGDSEVDDGPDSREAMCRRLGLDAALVAVTPRSVILEEHFLPIERSAAGEVAAREINRELLMRSMLDARNYDGYTPAEAVKHGGAARDKVLAMIDDCEWRLANADSESASMMPRPGELRRRLGIR